MYPGMYCVANRTVESIAAVYDSVGDLDHFNATSLVGTSDDSSIIHFFRMPEGRELCTKREQDSSDEDSSEEMAEELNGQEVMDEQVR
jgi:hypothetical protein